MWPTIRHTYDVRFDEQQIMLLMREDELERIAAEPAPLRCVACEPQRNHRRRLRCSAGVGASWLSTALCAPEQKTRPCLVNSGVRRDTPGFPRRYPRIVLLARLLDCGYDERTEYQGGGADSRDH